MLRWNFLWRAKLWPPWSWLFLQHRIAKILFLSYHGNLQMWNFFFFNSKMTQCSFYLFILTFYVMEHSGKQAGSSYHLRCSSYTLLFWRLSYDGKDIVGVSPRTLWGKKLSKHFLTEDFVISMITHIYSLYVEYALYTPCPRVSVTDNSSSRSDQSELRIQQRCGITGVNNFRRSWNLVWKYFI